jgi:hypothetical protein
LVLGVRAEGGTSLQAWLCAFACEGGEEEGWALLFVGALALVAGTYAHECIHKALSASLGVSSSWEWRRLGRLPLAPVGTIIGECEYRRYLVILLAPLVASSAAAAYLVHQRAEHAELRIAVVVLILSTLKDVRVALILLLRAPGSSCVADASGPGKKSEGAVWRP